MKYMMAGLVMGSVLLTGCKCKISKAADPVQEQSQNEVTSPEVWLTDVAEAKRIAAEKGLPIVINFSGSDWCGWCIKLDKEVFSKEAFLAYAKDNVVLLEADFPRQSSQPEAVAAQNKALAETYGIQGFPTILLIDATGKEIARTGYQRGGPEAYVKHLKALIAQK